MYFQYTVLTFLCYCVVVSASGDFVTVDGVVYASDGATVILNCSQPLPVVWYKNNIPVPNTSRQMINLVTGSLTFSPVLTAQAGWYSCVNTIGFNTIVEDHVLIVGSAPGAAQSAENPLAYNVVEGSRVVLGCLATGYPPPRVIWRDGFDEAVVESASVSVSPVSRALIIDNYNESHQEAGGYYCQLINELGSFNASRIDVSLTVNDTIVPSYISPLDGMLSPQYLPPSPRNDSLKLRCTGLNLSANNMTVRWFLDYSQLGKTNDRLGISTTAESGYYCCDVNYLDQQVNRHCITVWVGGDPELSPLLPPAILALPTNRQPRLPCVATQTTYDTPLVSWQRDSRPINAPVSGLNFVTVEGGGVYTCTATNNISSTSASVTVLPVQPCVGVNIVVSGDASDESVWNASNSNARLDTVNNEQVFVVDYSQIGTNLSQDLLQYQVTAVHISGRVRQIGSQVLDRGLATMRLTTSQDTVQLTNSDNVSQAWQWMALTRDFPQPVTLQSIQLLVEGGVSGEAHFDDVCVSVTLVEEVSYVGAVVGGVLGGVLLVLLLVGVAVGVVFCVYCRKNKHASMMKKMSFKMTKKSTREGVIVQGYTATDDNDTANRVYDSIRRGNDLRRDSNVDNYQYINPLDVPGPHNKTPQPNNSDGQYTALDPSSLDQHMYMTATPARSLASLHSGAAVVDGAGYLQVLPPSSLPLDDDGVYENSQDVRERCATSPAELEHQHDSNLYESV